MMCEEHGDAFPYTMSQKKPDLKKILQELNAATVELQRATNDARALLQHEKDTTAAKRIRRSIKT